MPNTVLVDQAKIQASYMQLLLDKAKKAVEGIPDNELAFDPQGRLLIDVTLEDAEIDSFKTMLGKAITKTTKAVEGIPDNELAFDPQVRLLIDDSFKTMLGKAITKTTTVSLHIYDNPHLAEKFNVNLKTNYDVNATIIDALHAQPKGSIIALQQEFHFHLGLAVRTYKKAAADKFKGKENQLQDAHKATILEVNKLVMAEFAKALKNATQNDALGKAELDIAKLNKALDKAREEITPKAHTLLMKNIVRCTGVILEKNDFNDLKLAAKKTTGTANAVLHTDSSQGLATLIEGSENTAHNRIEGTAFALRQIITHACSTNGRITANQNPRIQIRTPSLDVKTLPRGQCIADIKVKLAYVVETYGLQDYLSACVVPSMPKAFIYNLYTAINDRMGDLGGNLQTLGAEHILVGAHQYNQSQVEKKPLLFCFVQNISVNTFGDALRYNSGSQTLEEATLMTEMALMHTLFDNASVDQKKLISEVMQEYKVYLEIPNRAEYFSQTQTGKSAKEKIQKIKSNWRETTHIVDTTTRTVLANAKNTLTRLIANNLHFDHQYAKLIQSLSVFVEEASIGGCKSGNERSQCVNGRVAIFDTLLNVECYQRDASRQAVFNALENTALYGNDFEQNAQKLETALSDAYNLRLQEASSVISPVDQGGAAKVESKPDNIFFRFFYFSRNYAEIGLRYLQQSKAAQMQAHKGLTKSMRAAWEGEPVSMRKLMIRVFGIVTLLSAIAIVVGIVIAIPIALPYFVPIVVAVASVGAIVVAIVGALVNRHRKAVVEAANKALLTTVVENKDGGQSPISSSAVMLLGLHAAKVSLSPTASGAPDPKGAKVASSAMLKAVDPEPVINNSGSISSNSALN